ncbi:MAG: hypothetical protein Q8K92_26075 [Leadbetterella sp.]|nr:hypothetical protein [Leadbetterella sp.]
MSIIFPKGTPPLIGIEYHVGVTYAPRDISKEDFQKFWENIANRAKRIKFQARWYH